MISSTAATHRTWRGIPLYETTFDRDHEGYWGWRTDEIAGIITNITTLNPPEIVLIHLGTNDVGQLGAAGVTNADTNLRLIIDRIRAVVPTVTILLAQVIPSDRARATSRTPTRSTRSTP